MFLQAPPQSDLSLSKSRSKPVPTFFDNVTAGYGVARTSLGFASNSISPGLMMKDQWKPILEQIETKTGKRFSNPGVLFNPSDDNDVTRRQLYDNLSIEIQDHVLQNKDNMPELVELFNNPDWNNTLLEQAKTSALTTLEDYNELADESSGMLDQFGRIIGQLAGGPGNDPLVYLTLGLGGGAPSLYQAALREFVIGAGTSAIVEKPVKDWYETLGLDYSWEDFALAVGAGGVFGGATPFAFDIGGKTIRLTKKQVQAGVNAFKNSKVFKSKGAQTATKAAEGFDDVAATNPYEGGGNAEAAHRKSLKEATIASENNEIAQITSNVPIAKPKSIYDSDNIDFTKQRFKVDEIEIDAPLFQLKPKADSYGVTKKLSRIKKWDAQKAGDITVYEMASGQRYLIDGHQRVGLAKRLISTDPDRAIIGKQGLTTHKDELESGLFGTLFKEKDGITPEQAAVSVAVKNIVEQTLDPLDAAKVLKANPNIDVNLPSENEFVRTVRGIANLSDESKTALFKKIITPDIASAVGESLADQPELHKPALELLKGTELNRTGIENVLKEPAKEFAESNKGQEAANKFINNVTERLRTGDRVGADVGDQGRSINAQENAESISVADQEHLETFSDSYGKGQLEEAEQLETELFANVENQLDLDREIPGEIIERADGQMEIQTTTLRQIKQESDIEKAAEARMGVCITK